MLPASLNFHIRQSRATRAAPPLPPKTCAKCRRADRGVKCSTLGRRIAGIRHGHRLAGLASPTDDERVKAVMRGARRTLGVAPVKKTAATSDKVLAMVAAGKPNLAGKRDRAQHFGRPRRVNRRTSPPSSRLHPGVAGSNCCHGRVLG
jgi:hypothetical protein